MQQAITHCLAVCRQLSVEAIQGAPMREYTTFRIGGPAQLMAFVHTQAAFVALLQAANEQNLPCFVLGRGSNLLVSDAGVQGLVIQTGKLQQIKQAEENRIVCDCGVSLKKLCEFAAANSLRGLEFAYGIPGSVGGAVYMNAGAYGGEMRDVVVSCRAVSPQGQIETFTADQLALSYRHSALMQTGHTVLEVTVQLQPGDEAAIRENMQAVMQKRRDKQPLQYPSAGSTFKRPPGYFAAALIEQCGLKGTRVGDAQVSEKHSGFLINTGNATCQDMLQLIQTVQQTVLAKTGVQLETEVLFLQ